MSEKTRKKMKKKERSVDDMFIVITQEEEDYRNGENENIEKHVNSLINSGNLRCTVCDEASTTFLPHPAFRVLLCSNCNSKYEGVEFTKSSDGSDANCMWCAESVEDIQCSFCTCTFCEKCLKINFGHNFVREKSKWKCLVCNPQHLWWLRAICDKFMYYTDKRNIRSCKIEGSNHLAIMTNPTFYNMSISTHNNIETWSSDETEDEYTTYPTLNNCISSLPTSVPSKSYTTEDLLKNKEIDDIVQTIKSIKLRMDYLLDDITVNWTNFNKKDSLKYLTTLADSEKVFTKLQNFANKYSTEFKNISEQMLQQKTNLYEKLNLENKKNVTDTLTSIENTPDSIPSTSHNTHHFESNGYCDTLLQRPSLGSDELIHFQTDKLKCNKEVLSLKSITSSYDKNINKSDQNTTIDDMDISDSQLIDTYNQLIISNVIENDQNSVNQQKNIDSEINNNSNVICFDNITVQIKREMILEEESNVKQIEDQQDNCDLRNDSNPMDINIEIKKEILSQYEEDINEYNEANDINQTFNDSNSNLSSNNTTNINNLENLNSLNADEVSKNHNVDTEVSSNKECTKRMKELTSKLTDRLNKDNVKIKEKINDNIVVTTKKMNSAKFNKKQETPDKITHDNGDINSLTNHSSNVSAMKEKINENNKKDIKNEGVSQDENNIKEITKVDKNKVEYNSSNMKSTEKKSKNKNKNLEQRNLNPKESVEILNCIVNVPISIIKDIEDENDKKIGPSDDKNKIEFISSPIKAIDKNSKHKNKEQRKANIIHSKELVDKKEEKPIVNTLKDRKINESHLSKQNSNENNVSVQEMSKELGTSLKKIEKIKINLTNDKKNIDEKYQQKHKKDPKRNIVEKHVIPKNNNNEVKQTSNKDHQTTKDLDNTQQSENESKIIRRLSIEDYRKRCSQTDSIQNKNTKEMNEQSGNEISSDENSSHIESTRSKRRMSREDSKTHKNNYSESRDHKFKNINNIKEKQTNETVTRSTEEVQSRRMSRDDVKSLNNHSESTESGNSKSKNICDVKEKQSNEIFKLPKTTEENRDKIISDSLRNKENRTKNTEKFNNRNNKSPKRLSLEDHKNMNNPCRSEENKEFLDKKYKNEQNKKDVQPEKNISNVQKEISKEFKDKDIKRFKKVQSVTKNITDNIEDKQNETHNNSNMKSKPSCVNKINNIQDKNNQNTQFTENQDLTTNDQEKCNRLKTQNNYEENITDQPKSNTNNNITLKDQNTSITKDNIENIDPSSTSSNLNQIIPPKNDQVSEVKLTIDRNEVKVLKYINGIPEKVQRFLNECAKFDEKVNPKLLPSKEPTTQDNFQISELNITQLLKETSQDAPNHQKTQNNTNTISKMSKQNSNSVNNDKQVDTVEMDIINKQLDKETEKNNLNNLNININSIPTIIIKKEPDVDTSAEKSNLSPFNEIDSIQIKVEPIDPKIQDTVNEKPRKDRLEVPAVTYRLNSSIKTERPDDIDNLSSISGETQILENQRSLNVLNENPASSTATIPYIFKEEKQLSDDNLIGKLYERQRILEDFEEDYSTDTNIASSDQQIIEKIKQENTDYFEKETQINQITENNEKKINNNPQQDSTDFIYLSDSEQSCDSSECEDAYISLLCDTSNSVSDSDLSESSNILEHNFENVGRIDSIILHSDHEVSSKHSEESYKRLYNVRESYVYLGQRVEYDEWKQDFENMKKKKEIYNEEQEINRLTNLANLDNISKNKQSDQKERSNNKKKLNTNSKRTSIENESIEDSFIEMESNSDNDFAFLPALSEINTEKNPEPSTSLFIDDYSDVDLLNNSDNQINSKNNNDNIDDKKIKKRKTNDVTDNDAITKESSTNSDEPKKKRSKWRNDPLLNQKLGSSDSDDTYFSSTDELNKNGEKPNKIKKKIKRRTSNAESTKTSKTTSTNSISSDSNDSDIEFVSCFENSESTNKYKRRNIRRVVSDEFLQEATKQAIKEEEKRKLRITQKQLTLDLICSQPETQEEGGIVLDVDEDAKPLIKINKKLVNNLKSHQIEGVKFMWSICFESVKRSQEDSGVGCILAHCMGLGKTRQIVVLSQTLLSHKILNVKNILIVCPLSTVSNWKNEFKSTLRNLHNNNVRTFDMRANFNFQKKFQTVKLWKEMGGVLILGYDTFQALVNYKKNKTEQQINILYEALINPGPQLIVCDEGHMLKNGKTLRFKSLSNVATKRRIILTGTPLQNNLKEYYHMVNFVKPNLLGTESEYNNRFVNPILNGQYEDSSPEDIHIMRKRAHVLHKKLETTVQRFETSELEKYMPSKLDYVVYLEMSELQIKLYKRYLEIIEKDIPANNKKKTLFYNYHSLQHIWTHPAMMKMKLEKKNDKKQKLKTYDEDYIIDLDPDNIDPKETLSNAAWFTDLCPDDIKDNIKYGPKMEILFTIIKECRKLNEKLLVFASSLVELDLIERFLRLDNSDGTWTKNIDYFRMDGTVEPETRSRLCESFNNERNTTVKVFLISHKVGGLGLNLFAANRVVLMDVNWNPTYDDQSVYRIYRFGQRKKCTVYRLVSMGTMEEVVHSRAITKLAISARVVDEQQIIRHFKSDDLQKMYRLDCEYQSRSIPERPQDSILTTLVITHSTLNKYCKHKTLLQNLPHEELNEEEQNEAWKEFNREIEIENERLKMKNSLINTKTSLLQAGTNLMNCTVNNVTNQQNEQSNALLHTANYHSNYPYPTYSNLQSNEQIYNAYNDMSYNQFFNPNIQTNNIQQSIVNNMQQNIANSMQQNMSLNSNYINMPSMYQQRSDQRPYLQSSFEYCLSDFMSPENNMYNNGAYNTNYAHQSSSVHNFYNQNQSMPYNTINNQTSISSAYLSNSNGLNCNYNMNNTSTSNQQYINVPHQSPINSTEIYKPIVPNTNKQSSISTINTSKPRQPRFQNNLENRNIIQINTTASYLNINKTNIESDTNNTRNIITINTENLPNKTKEQSITSASSINTNSFNDNQVSSSNVNSSNLNKSNDIAQIQGDGSKNLVENKLHKISGNTQAQNLTQNNALKNVHIDKIKNSDIASSSKDVLIQHAEKLQSLQSLSQAVDNSTKDETLNNNLNCSKQIICKDNETEKENKIEENDISSTTKKTPISKVSDNKTNKNPNASNSIKLTENISTPLLSKTISDSVKESKEKSSTVQNKSTSNSNEDNVILSSSEESNKNSPRSNKYTPPKPKKKSWRFARNYSAPYNYNNIPNRGGSYVRTMYDRDYTRPRRMEPYNPPNRYAGTHYKNPNDIFNYYGRRQY